MTGLLLRNARLLDGPHALVDLVVRDGRIESVEPVGPDRARVSASELEEIQLDGRWVVPGLWDHHVHFSQWAMVRQRLDVSGATSAAEVASIVRAQVDRRPPLGGTVLVGFGFRDGLWPDVPTLEQLEVGPHAVALVSGDVHTVWLNRVAQGLLGLSGDDWFLREQPAFDVNVRLSEVPHALLDAWASDATTAAAARGVVGIRDLEMDDAGAGWLRRVAAGARNLRVEAAVYPKDADAARDRGQASGQALVGGEGLVVGGPFKIFADGSLNTRTAWCYDEYPGSAGVEARGMAIHDPAELERMVRFAVESGWAPTIHAIGDRATTLALDAFEATSTRGTIEHAQLVTEADLPRFARLGVAASVQPEHAMDDRDVAEHYWPGRTGRSFALRSLLDAAAELRFGSDAPVAPLDPWVTISAAVHRMRDGLPSWHPEQRLTLAEALAASVRSHVAPGEPADLAILDADPRTASPAELRALPVAGTLLAGTWTHRGY